MSTMPGALRRLGAAFVLSAVLLLSVPAATVWAACRIAGDCIALGLGMELRGCVTDAKVGIMAQAVVARAAGGPFDWLIVSAGSNNVPRGLPAVQLPHQRALIMAALDTILAGKGSARLLVILPANGARPIVAAWATAHGVATVSFAAGGDGIHPRSYPALRDAVLAVMRAAS